MNIFEKDYPYRLKLLGFTIKSIDDETLEKSIYIESHGILYIIRNRRGNNSKNNKLFVENSYSLEDLNNVTCYGIYEDKFLDIKNVKIEEITANQFKLRKELIKMFFKKSVFALVSNPVIISEEEQSLLIIGDFFRNVDKKKFIEHINKRIA